MIDYNKIIDIVYEMWKSDSNKWKSDYRETL